MIPYYLLLYKAQLESRKDSNRSGIVLERKNSFLFSVSPPSVWAHENNTLVMPESCKDTYLSLLGRLFVSSGLNRHANQPYEPLHVRDLERSLFYERQ